MKRSDRETDLRDAVERFCMKDGDLDRLERALADYDAAVIADARGDLAVGTRALDLADVRAALLVLPPPGNFDEYAKAVHQRLLGLVSA